LVLYTVKPWMPGTSPGMTSFAIKTDPVMAFKSGPKAFGPNSVALARLPKA
jgi:hypothetical protein